MADDVAIAREANARHILVRPLSRYYLTAARKKGLLFCFSASSRSRSICGQCVCRQPSKTLNADAICSSGWHKTPQPEAGRYRGA
jgi:hypothetical protein